MNPYMRRWIDALRSGEYKQARGRLRLQGFEEGWDKLSRLLARTGEKIPINRLIEMNDAHLKSFAQIADYLEERFA